MAKQFEGKAGIVTGASSGFGRLIAETLGADGMELWLVGRSSTELDKTAELVAERKGPKAHCVPMDLAKRGKLAELVSEVGRAHPYLFTLINNAGVMYAESIVNADPARWHEMFQINLMSPMEGCRAAVTAMRKHGKPGHLINFSSMASRVDLYGAYGVSKAAVNHMGNTLRRELEQDNIRICTIIPGGFATNLIRGFNEEMLGRIQVASERVKFDPASPEARKVMGDPARVASVVKYVLEQPIELNLEEIVIRPAVSLDLH
jgi:NADP-dependent 3-hydroxy acid dehydrogenase YdfG